VLRVTVASFVALVLRFGNPRATKIASADAAQKGETEKSAAAFLASGDSPPKK
jgi:hypothetical protein